VQAQTEFEKFTNDNAPEGKISKLEKFRIEIVDLRFRGYSYEQIRKYLIQYRKTSVNKTTICKYYKNLEREAKKPVRFSDFEEKKTEKKKISEAIDKPKEMHPPISSKIIKEEKENKPEEQEPKYMKCMRKEYQEDIKYFDQVPSLRKVLLTVSARDCDLEDFYYDRMSGDEINIVTATNLMGPMVRLKEIEKEEFLKKSIEEKIIFIDSIKDGNMDGKEENAVARKMQVEYIELLSREEKMKWAYGI